MLIKFPLLSLSLFSGPNTNSSSKKCWKNTEVVCSFLLRDKIVEKLSVRLVKQTVRNPENVIPLSRQTPSINKHSNASHTNKTATTPKPVRADKWEAIQGQHRSVSDHAETSRSPHFLRGTKLNRRETTWLPIESQTGNTAQNWIASFKTKFLWSYFHHQTSGKSHHQPSHLNHTNFTQLSLSRRHRSATK